MEVQHFAFLKYLLRFKRQVYLDYNATTNVSRRVRKTINEVLKRNYGNPSALYGMGRKSAEILENARQSVANTIHADPQEIFFTGCATESNNALLKSLSNYFAPRRRKIISTPIEHPSVLETLQHLKEQGVEVVYCQVDEAGRVILDELETLIDDQTFLICCILANNEVGTIQDIKSITRMARKYNVLVMSDCVQALGKVPLNMAELDVDYASFSAHKLHGPKGIGALYVKRGSPFVPYMHGGQQEEGMRAGTESLHNIAGFGVACEDVDQLLSRANHIQKLKQECIVRFRQIKPDCIINSPEQNCLPNTLSITFPGFSNAELMAMLDNHGIAVSAGSACSSAEDKPSEVLKAIGLSDTQSRETIRISLGTDTSRNDIRYAVHVFRNYFEGRLQHVNMYTAAEVTEEFLFNDDVYVLDVRPQYLRNKLKSLPNAHEANFFSIKKYLHQIPVNKQILVVCQHGNFSYVISYYLKKAGFRHVNNLLGGTVGWKKYHRELYEKYAGQQTSKLQQVG